MCCCCFCRCFAALLLAGLRRLLLLRNCHCCWFCWRRWSRFMRVGFYRSFLFTAGGGIRPAGAAGQRLGSRPRAAAAVDGGWTCKGGGEGRGRLEDVQPHTVQHSQTSQPQPGRPRAQPVSSGVESCGKPPPAAAGLGCGAPPRLPPRQTPELMGGDGLMAAQRQSRAQARHPRDGAPSRGPTSPAALSIRRTPGAACEGG